MESVVFTSSDLDRFGSWAPGLHVLVAQCRDHLEEVLALSHEELLVLAESVPFDRRIAEQCMPSLLWDNGVCQSDFDRWLARFKRPEEPTDCDAQNYQADYNRFHTWEGPLKSQWRCLALYVAAAAKHTVAKFLEDMLELSKQKLAILNRLNGVLDLARKMPATLAAMKGKEHLPELLSHINGPKENSNG